MQTTNRSHIYFSHLINSSNNCVNLMLEEDSKLMHAVILTVTVGLQNHFDKIVLNLGKSVWNKGLDKLPSYLASGAKDATNLHLGLVAEMI